MDWFTEDTLFRIKFRKCVLMILIYIIIIIIVNIPIID